MEETSLTRYSRFVKNEWVLILCIFAGLLIVLALIFSVGIKKNPVKQIGVPYKESVYPGKSNEDKVRSVLGQPVKTEASGSSNIFYYPTTNKYRQDKIDFENKTVTLIKEQVIGKEKGKLVDYLQKYGNQESIFYGPHGAIAPGYFWGTKGVMVFANPKDGTIIEIWYFVPQTEDVFLQENNDVKKTLPAVIRESF